MKLVIEFIKSSNQTNNLSQMNFSDTVVHALQYYVYRLVDPRDNQTFYVGKGRDNRAFQHVESVKTKTSLDSPKELRIKTILDAGLTPLIIIHRHGLDENTAFEVEAALIDAYPELDNDQGGHDNQERGIKTVRELHEQYDLPEMPTPDFSTLIINVNHIKNRLDRSAIYQQVRGHWVVNVKNAQKAKYVIAAYKGVAIGIFEPIQWFPSDLPRRYCFEGKEASNTLWEKYVGTYGKRIENKALKNGQNPIKYFFI